MQNCCYCTVRAKRALAYVNYRRHGLVSNFFEYPASHKADLATERERLLTTARVLLFNFIFVMRFIHESLAHILRATSIPLNDFK